MKTITFDRFECGIDWRKGPSVSDANRLRELRNAYVTTGLAVQKRPGCVKVATLEPGTKGLFAAEGRLHTFYDGSKIKHADRRFKAHWVATPGEGYLTHVHFVEVFNGYLYVVAGYSNTFIRHHWLNGDTRHMITDDKCPHSAAVIKTAQRIFAVNGDTVHYCTLDRPRIWSRCPEDEQEKDKDGQPTGRPKDKEKWGNDDAGFLPTGLNFKGDSTAHALGMYHNQLVVLSRDGVQLWQADPDPSAMKLTDRVENVGTHFPHSLATVNGDLYFLTDAGFRSITTLQYTNSSADVDIGSPIDPLVQAALKPLLDALSGPHATRAATAPRALYVASRGQYWCLLGEEVFVYSTSRTAKITAWSRYRFPFVIDALTELNGALYLRSGDDVYRLSDDAHTDNGTPFEVAIELPYMDCQAPGELKRLMGAQVIAEGDCALSIGYDETHPQAATPPVRVTGAMRAAGRLPFQLRSRAFAARVHNRDDKPFRLDALTLYIEPRGM